MWCYLESKNIDSFKSQYPIFQDTLNDYIILQIKDACFLPRLFYYNYPSEYLIQYFGKKQIPLGRIENEFYGDLRPAQKSAASTIKKIFETQGFVNGILKLPPGAGKTVLTVYIACMLKLKTCIIIDSTSLLKQWIEAIIKFANLTENDIGLIKGKIFVTNKPFTIAMTQSLSSKIKRDFNKTVKIMDESQFGLVVYDEVHTTSSTSVYSKVNILFRTPNVLGLSATPFHQGMSKILMENTIGKLIFESNEYEMTPEYKMIFYNSKLQKYSYVMNTLLTDYIQRKGYYNKILVNSDVYITLVVKLAGILRNKGHNVFIVCMNKKQVEIISENLEIKGLENRRYTGDETEIDKENDNIIVSTYAFTGKGFDMSRLGGLILACPLSGKKSVIQVVGRVLRSYQGKIQPIVYDLVDLCFPMFSLPEVKRKQSIIANEFPNCKIETINIEEKMNARSNK